MSQILKTGQFITIENHPTKTIECKIQRFFRKIKDKVDKVVSKEHSEVYSQNSMPLPKLTSYRKLARLQIFRYEQQFQTLL